MSDNTKSNFFNFREKAREAKNAEGKEEIVDFRKPKRETLSEHLKHCKAKEGECPFVKKAMKIDELDANEKVKGEPTAVKAEEKGQEKVVDVGDVKKKSPSVFVRLAEKMTDLKKFADSLNVENDDEKIVVEAVTEGLDGILEKLEKNDCAVTKAKTDDGIVILPPKTEG